MNRSNDRWLLGLSFIVTVFFQLLAVAIYFLTFLLVIGAAVLSYSVWVAEVPPPNHLGGLGSETASLEQSYPDPRAGEI